MEINIMSLGGSKSERYDSILEPIKDLLGSESDTLANMANLTAVLKETFHFLWVGFYLVKGEQLVLGPFQGTLACTRIGYGKGVCGTAWKEKKPIVVDNVDLFPGHIACSNLSKSEIVLPLENQNEVWAVLDIDHDEYATFDSVDLEYLTKILQLIKKEV
jgi:GAF domain-containing protein